MWELIHTKRLSIKSIGTIDATDPVLREIVGWLNNPLVVRFSEQRHRKHTIKSQSIYMSLFNNMDYYLGIYLDEDILIGTATVLQDAPNRTANIGIMIGDHSIWGFGYGYEAWLAICDRILGGVTRKVEAGCMACNTSMMSICSRYGMMEEGRQEDHFLYHDVPMDLVHWGKIK